LNAAPKDLATGFSKLAGKTPLFGGLAVADGLLERPSPFVGRSG
jgi:hypothetical protein